MYRLCPHKPGWNFGWLRRHASQGMKGFQMDCPIGSSGQYYAHLMQGVCYCDGRVVIDVPQLYLWDVIIFSVADGPNIKTETAVF
jgi:hypothetical protein